MGELDVPALLDRARELRAGHRAESPSPVDTAYCITGCAACGATDAYALGYAGSLLLDGQERETTLSLFEALTSLFGPRVGAADAVARCPCGAAARPDVLAIRYFHAVGGSGADLMAQALFDLADDAPSWSIARVPDDGTVSWLSPDDDAVAAAFGAPMRPAALVRRLASAQGATVGAYGEGLWWFAGPRESPALDAALAALATSPARVCLPVEAASADEPTWRSLHVGLRPAGFRFGAVIDLAVLAHLTRIQARRHGALATRSDDPLALSLRVGELSWPIDLTRVARECVRLGLSLPAGAAAAVGSALMQLAGVASFVARVRAADPSVRWECESTRLFPLRADGTRGRPFDLLIDPMRLQSSELDLLRDLRFNVDQPESHVDPDRICPCGAALSVAPRLASWAFVEALLRAPAERQPVVLETFARDDSVAGAAAPVAAVFVASECSRHLRPFTVSEQARLGLRGAALIDRIEQDVGRSTFVVELDVSADPAGRRILVARGPWVASVLLAPTLLAGLLGVAGRPIAGAEARVTAFGEHALAVAETGYDPARWESLASDLRRHGGEGRDDEVSFVMERHMITSAAPLGTFKVLSRMI